MTRGNATGKPVVDLMKPVSDNNGEWNGFDVNTKQSMISEPLEIPSWSDPEAEAMAEPRWAAGWWVRDRVVAAAVVLAHGLALYQWVHQRSVVLHLESGKPAGGSVQVHLVAAPVPRSVLKPEVKTAPKPAIEAPTRKPPKVLILSSHAPDRRSLETAPPEPAKPAAQAAAPAVAAPSDISAQPVQPAAPVDAAPVPNLLAAPKEIGAGELKELGCQMPQPQYPPKARRLQQEGTVVVRLIIGTDGAVASASVAQSSGSSLLDASALDAIRAGHCRSYVSAGIAHTVEATQPITFNLND